MKYKKFRVPFKRCFALLFATLAAVAVYTQLYPTAHPKIDVSRLKMAQSILSVNSPQGRTLFVFESSDCVFCRRMHPELAKVPNVRLYTFILPGHTEESRFDARAAWCAPDPVASWNAIMESRSPTEAAVQCDAAVLDKNVADARSIGLTVTPTLIDASGRVLVGFHTAFEINEWMSGE